MLKFQMYLDVELEEIFHNEMEFLDSNLKRLKISLQL